MTKSLSRWELIMNEAQEGAAIWVGVDVHKKSYAVAILSERGTIHTFTTTSDNAGLVEQFKSRNIPVTCLAYESGLTGFGLYRACQKAGIPAIVAPVSRIPRTPCKKAKTDRTDCVKLANYLSRGLLPSVTVPGETEEAMRSKVRRRSQVVKELGQVKNRIKSFLVVNSLREPEGLQNWSRRAVEELRTMPMHVDHRVAMDSYLRELCFLIDEISVLERDIRQTVVPKDDVLQSIPGVGEITSAIFRTEVFDPTRFATSEELVSYLGLAPVIHQSGNQSGTGRLIPCGQGKLRGTLVEAAWVLRSKEQWAAEFYGRILRRTGKFQKAIVALARKLAIIMWRLWLENRPYQSVLPARAA